MSGMRKIFDSICGIEETRQRALQASAVTADKKKVTQ
jgi:hypothetical protein